MSPLFPSGKRRYIKAQGLDSYNMDSHSLLSPSTPGQEPPAQGLQNDNPASMFNDNSFDLNQNIQGQEEQEESGDSDIMDYIMKKLESFGYPPRRLNEFKNEFVSEKLLPGSTRDVSIVIPDMYYGKAKRLKGEEISKIIEEIQNHFGLQFKDGERKDKKVFLNFVSQGQNSEEDGEAAMGDELDEAFGGGGAQKVKQKKKVAETQYEMMKSAMNEAFEKLNKR